MSEGGEDGIRRVAVTGVQTCALPISLQHVARLPPVLEGAEDEIAGVVARLVGDLELGDAAGPRPRSDMADADVPGHVGSPRHLSPRDDRSEERRVGKERRCRRGAKTAYAV